MKVLPEQATGYTAVVAIVALVVGWIIAMIMGSVTGVPLSDTW
jgi:hypothetical protein